MNNEGMKRNRDELLAAIAELPLPEHVSLMEVCGTHTMAIARSGIKSLLPKKVSLLSGPGCPVCVTPPGVIDEILALSMQNNIVVATYGDMVRVPGSTPGDHLAYRRAKGANVHVVYSPVDAVEYAARNPEKEIVFLGVGFETTAPGTAAAVLTARERGITNFSLFSMLKTVEPALRTLIASDEFSIQGFLCPGHVASIIGEKGFAFLPNDYRLPAVIAGFEAGDILIAIYRLLRQIAYREPKLENEYMRAVSPDGNQLAQRILSECFERKADEWRGLGVIESSALKLADSLADYDAEKKYSDILSDVQHAQIRMPCRCGEVITGRLEAEQCPMFAKRCVPEDPVGPCMVSSEGACAAAYKYGSFERWGRT